MRLSDATAVCKKLAVKAGEAIMKIYATDFEVKYKDDLSPLTLADTASNDIIVAGLRTNYPSCAILSEESYDDSTRLANDWCFIVDPLDGTKEFAKRNGEFTVNIALSYKGKSVVGVIYAPVTEQLYYAYNGRGAYYCQSDSLEIPIHVSNRLDALIFAKSKSHSGEKEAELLQLYDAKIAEIISVGSSLKGCMVAAGKADIYYRFGFTKEWDTAAMQCIVEAAGGIFKQMDGSEMRYNRENTLNDKGFFAVNRRENIWLRNSELI